MRRIAILFIITLLIFLSSCGEPRGSEELMAEFLLGYGEVGTLYTPSVPEGERGFAYEGFLEALYGDISGGVSDFAIVLRSDGMETYECAVFVAHSEYDASLISDACYSRLELIKSLTVGEGAHLDDAFVMRRGETVVFCALSDGALAEALWKSIL